MKKWDKYFTILFFSILVFLAVGIFFEAEDFSYKENRYLAEYPKFSWDKFYDSSYMTEVEEFIDDHLWEREGWIYLKNSLESISGKRDIENVYLGKEGYLFEKMTSSNFNYENFKQNIQIIEEFSKKYPNTSFLLVPSKGYILKDKLPSFAPYIDEEELFKISKQKSFQFIDVLPTFLEHQSEYIYYKTDHHWTTLGAFYAYQTWKKQAFKEDYTWTLKSDNFKGSLDSKVLGINNTQDEIWIANDKSDDELIKNSTRDLYDFEKLKEKDQYQLFLGGNTGEVTFETNQNNKKSLLLFKDSFANSFIPFLIKDYQYIYIIDLRYFNQDIASYIEKVHPTEILFLYGINNLTDDLAIHKLQNME